MQPALIRSMCAHFNEDSLKIERLVCLITHEETDRQTDRQTDIQRDR